MSVINKLSVIRGLIVLCFAVCSIVPAWAGHDTNYARVTVTASPTGQGKVYMTTNKDYTPGSEDWQDSMSEDWNCKDGIGPSEEDTRTYYVHAQAESGYHFAKWSSNSSGTGSKSTANPYAYSTSTSSTSSGSPTQNNIYAIFEQNPQYTCTFLISTNGTYKYQYGDHEEVTVTSEHSVTTDQNFTFTALPDPGYQVYGWYTESGGTKTYFNYSSYVLSSYALPGDIHIGVDFIPVGTPIFQIKGTTQMFTDLNAAVTACGGAAKTIVLINNGTLPAGEYTIPTNVTLLIPFDAVYTCYTETPGTIDSYTFPAAYRTLTMSPGARLIVNGKISLSAKVSGKSYAGPCGAPSESYGAIKMLSEGETKSTITLNNGAKLYSWGYIYGEGAVEVLSGAEVHEGFAFMDFRGAQNTYDMNSDSHKVFPFNQYYIQNIEVPLTIHYGATEKVFSCLYPGGNEVQIPITMVGSSDGLFRLSGEGSKLTKWYDPHDDRQHYALEGNAAIRNISFTVTLIMSITVNSANFVLPITNNMDITVRSGATVSIAEDICIMPDASVTVEQGAIVNIAKNVYVYDKQAYTNADTYTTSRGGYPEAGPGRYAAGAYVRCIAYSPSWATIPDREIRRLAIMHTARFKINGTLNVNGKLYTTEGGADIFSTADGATINLVGAVGTSTVTYQVDHQNYDAYYYSIPITSAQLHNADQSYAPTAGSPAGAAWTYKHGHWGWKIVWMWEDGTVLKTAYHYAQPDASWISSNAPSTDRADEGTCSYSFNGWNTTTHTENQEVTVVADYTKTCTNYYTVTWKSEDGTETLETDEQVGQGENTRYNGATPFKPFDTESSRLYTFDGWATEPNGEKVYDTGATPAASGDAIYYAHFAVTEVVAIVKADDDTTYCTSIAEAFEVVRNTNFTPTIQVWKDASIPALVYNIENYCTLDLNGHTLTSVTSSVQSPFNINKSNITFTITDSSESQSGKLSMTTTYGSTIFGLFVQNGNLQLNGGTIEVISGSATTCGVTVNSNCSFTMNGGKIHVVTSNNREGRGIYSVGTVLINDGTVHVEAAGVGYGIKRDGGTFAVNGGKFNINGSSSYINYGADTDANIAIKGGYYTTNSRLANVVPSPYLVYDWASPGEPYHYTVAAKVGYTVTFQNTDETTLQTGTWVEGTTPAYAGETPTKPGDTEGEWMFDHWTPDLVPVTEDVTYTAVYVPTPPVASVTISGSTTEYIHFDDAWTAANTATAAATLTLLQDVTVTTELTYNNSNNKNCILDLNGHTLTSNTSQQSPLHINNTNVTFTVTDGTEEKAGKLSLNTSFSTKAIFGAYVESGNLLLNTGTIEVTSSTATACGVTINTGTFTMNGGTIHVKTTSGKEGRGIYANSTTTVNGGTVHVEAAGIAYGVRHDGGIMTINDGKFSISGSTASYMNYTDAADNKLIIKGGYYNIDTRLGTYVSNPYHIFELTSGAEFDEGYRYKVAEAYNLTWTTDGELSGEGYTPAGLTAVGTLIVAPTSTKEGYVFAGWTPAVADAMPSADTEYTAQWAVASVTIGETTTLHTTFADAWSAVNSASAASTLKLLDDVDLTTGLEYTNASKNCMLDLNGHIISGSATPLLKIAQDGITFTITDLTEAKEGRIECNTHINGQKWAVEVSKSTLRFEGGTIYAKNTHAGQLFIGIYSGSSGVIEMSGGNIHIVTTANNPTYGMLTFSTATISSGSIQVEAAGTGYAVEARNSKSNVTITGGDFYATGSSAACVHTEGSGASLTLQGGYYNTNTNLAANCATNYHVFQNDDATYLYKVAEGYTVTFNTNGHGSAPESQLIEKNTRVTTPTAPTAEGYTIGGWYKEAGCETPWNFASDVVTAATTLYAQWTVHTHKFAWDFNGGTPSGSYTEANDALAYGSVISYPTMTKTGYTFAGWSSDATTMPDNDLIITASWTINQYTISFDSNGGSAVASITQDYNTAVIAPANPTKTGYTFNGWSPAVPNPMPAEDTECEAQWTRDTYTISYELNGGSVASENPTSYTVESGAITLNNPTKANYVFAGWTGTDLAVATMTVTIPAGSTGDRSYTATWTPAVASVTVNDATTLYTTFDDAWSAVNSATAASTIQLLQNVSVASYKTYNNSNNKNCTLDLNGHTLTGTGQTVLHPNKSGTTFTLTDRSTDHDGKIIALSTSVSASYGVFVEKGTFVMEAGTIDGQFSKNTLQGVRVGASGSFRMEGGTIHVKTTNEKEADGIYANGATTINGGTIEVEADGNGYGIYYNDNTTTVNAGYFYLTASGSAYVTNQASANANVVITGGKYNTDAQLETCVSAPYHVFGLTSGAEFDEGYRYKVAEGYTVTFKNEDETLQSGLWEKGTTPIYSGETPAKAADAQYSYTFDDWSPAIAPVTADVIYTAQFSSTVNTYTVTWKDADGTTLETDENVPYGTTPAYNGATPTKTTDAEYAYTFNGWSPTVSAVTGDATYTATYTTTPVVASVTVNSTTAYYTSFADAWTAANSATAAVTLTLLRDVTFIAKLTYNNSNNKNCTLDLNGHTLTSNTSENSPLHINNANVTFTITDGTEEKAGKLSLNTSSSSTIFGAFVDNGTLLLNAGTIEARSGSATTGAVTVNANGTFTMEGGTLHVVTTNNRNGRGVYSYNNVTINDGTIHVEAAGTGYGIYLEANKKATVNGGKFNISGSTANKSCICNTTTANTNLLLLGGWYNTNLMTDGTTASNINTKYVAPGKSCNYHVFDLSESELPYKYKVAEGYTVTFNANGHGSAPESQLIEMNAHASEPTAPTAEGYTFGGWYKEAGCETPWNFASDVVTAVTTLFAKWIVHTHKFAWDFNGGTPSGSYTEANDALAYGSVISYPTMTKTGYTFAGWSSDATTMPDNDLIITASWTINQYTISFDSNGGSAVASITQDYNTAVTTPANPSRTGYTFNGWSPAVPNPMPAEDTECEAQWTRDTYTISYELNGGSVASENPTSYTVESGAITLNNPTKANYVFAGWTGTDLAVATMNVTIPAGSTGDCSYTATWTPAVASVTVNDATTLYTTFDDAWTAATGAGSASTLTLLGDVAGLASSRTYSASHDLTLDLNGHTLSGAGTSLFQIRCTGYTFTVTDGSANHNGKLLFTTAESSTSSFHCVIVNNGTFVLEAGTIEATSSTVSIGAVQVTGGTFTMNENGAIHAKYTGNVSGKNSRLVHANGGTTTINGGTIHLESTKDGIGVVYGSGNVTFNGGKFKIVVSGTAAVTNKNSAQTNLNIRGGYYSANDNTYFTPHVKTPYHIFANADAEYPQKVAEGYTVTFNNYDDTSLQSGVWENGTTPTYSGETPTKPADAQYTYTFNGWSPAISSVTASATYTATYSSTVNNYTVLWKNADGTTLETDEDVPYGTTPTYDGPTPTKATDEEGIYTFNGWSPAVGAITDNTEYTATYSTTPVVASVTISGATTYYTTFAGTGSAWEAANSATAASTIKLLSNITATSILTYNNSNTQDCTLDLNGHTISSTQQAVLNPTKAGITFTLTDNSENHNGKLLSNATDAGTAYGVLVSAGTFVMENGTIEAHLKANTSKGIRVSGGASFTMNDGKIEVETTNSKSGDGVFTSAGNATVTINGGKIRVHAAATGYAVNVAGTTTITGGKFYATGTGATACVVNTGTLTLQGGYYNSATNLATYTFAPYVVRETTVADKAEIGVEYTHKVVENDEKGFSLDIVDWTASTLTINANGWTASGWPYTINDVEYAKEARAADRTLTIPYSGEAGTELRIEVQDKDDNIVSLHRYTIPFIGTTSGTSASSTIYVNSGTLTIDASETPTIAALYIRPEASVNVTNGTLTVGKLVMRTLPWQAAAISGDFEAEEVWNTRIAPNKRTISGPGGEITYESASYYQFSLPLNCTVSLNEIQVSNAANTPYGNTWLLKRYDEPSRAANGAGTDNWVALNGNETIQGGVGYELFSNSNYYREFYFPLGAVNSASLGNTTAVRYDFGAAGEKHAGWNIVASPLMSVYDNSDADPEEGMKVSMLLTDGSYDQGVPEYIYPAIPFSYQASEGQTVISFEGSSIVAAAPLRSMEEESVRKQWLHLDIKNANGVGDQTSILTHPTRYEETYKTGIDVAKQSFEASRALIYSTHTYGEMAFAGVSDELLKRGVALTVYSPLTQNLTISMRDNNWLERMRYVWLIDHETGAYTDLLWEPYTFEAVPGTTANRFTIQGVFRTPQVTTDVENGVNGENGARKVIINDKMYIILNGRMYDAVGKIVK